MFKLTVPITKAVSKGNKLIVRGVASDPTIDRDQERFDVEAIAKMKDTVNSQDLPIRIEHEDKIYTDIGVWKLADIDEDNKLIVEGEIDTELSLGKDIKVLLKRGMQMALSVGGRIIDAGFEYSKELQKEIKVYRDVILEEISVVKNPANTNATLSLAKSIDWKNLNVAKTEDSKKVVYTTQAQQLIKHYKSMEKLSPADFQNTVTEKAVKTTPGRQVVTKWSQALEDSIMKVFEKMPVVLEVEVSTEDSEPQEIVERGLTPDDFKAIAQIIQIISKVDLPTDEEVDAMYDDRKYIDTVNDLGESGYIILYDYDRMQVMPHHNLDYTLNKDWVLFQMKRLIDGQSYWKPKDFTVIMNHLYTHLKELALVKSRKVKNPNSITKSKAGKISETELSIMKQAFDYCKGICNNQPKLNGEVISNQHQLEKLAEAHEKLSKYSNFIKLSNPLEHEQKS